MDTVTQLLTEHLETWTATVQTKSSAGRGGGKKRELYGIKKLRELILDLAVRGLLVPQNANEKPVSELLKDIEVERDQLYRSKQIKRKKKLQPITEEEGRGRLPEGWENVRLNDIGDWGAGATPRRGDLALYGGDIPWFKSGELTGDYIETSEETVTELALEKSSLRFNKAGDVLIAMYGATIGKTSILRVPATTNQAVCACTPFTGVSNQYLLTLLKAYKPTFTGMGAGGAQPNISREKIINTVAALPPTAEQHRIVAKVDELMALCDRLEQAQSDSIETHETLVATLLDALIASASDAEHFQQAWQRIAAHFDALFTTEASIDQLKQTILQLAVMGKLVEQDPEDEPTSKLVKVGLAEKAKQIEEGKIKKQKELPPIDIDQIPFSLPGSWSWVRLSDVSFFQEGPGILAKDFRDTGVPLIRISGMHGASVSLDGCNYLDKGMVDDKWAHFRLDLGDIVLSSSASLGKVSKVTKETVGCIVYTGLIRFKTYQSLFEGYLVKFFESAEFVRQINRSKTGAAIKHFGPTHLKGMLAPLPPLAEQHRIVAKVDELMALCDALKAKLGAAQATQRTLTDSLVEQAIN